MILRAVEAPARLSAHPAAEIFPLLTGDDMEELVDDVRAHGLLDPIVLHPDGRILDGRSRYEACSRADVPIRTEAWIGELGTEGDYVVSRNLKRRHLTTSQRAMIAVEIKKYEMAAAKLRMEHRGPSIDRGEASGKASAIAAGRMRVSTATVERAARVAEDGAPELVDAVKAGDVSVDAAATISELPVEEQAELFARGEKEILAAAKKIKEQRKRSTQGALHSSSSDEWFTPHNIITAARMVLGEIDLDPASSPEANTTVRARAYYSADLDGLDPSKHWEGRVWLNPPYGKDDAGESNAGKWSARLIEEYEAGRIHAAILLVNATTDRSWFRALWRFPICFLFDRIRFTPSEALRREREADGKTGEDQPSHGNVLVYFGPDVDAFDRVCSQIGHVVLPREPRVHRDVKPANVMPKKKSVAKRSHSKPKKAPARATKTRPAPSKKPDSRERIAKFFADKRVEAARREKRVRR